MIEVLHIEPEGTVCVEVHQVVVNSPDVPGFPKWGKGHQLVCTGVDLEPCIVGNGGIQEPERVWKGYFTEGGEGAVLTEPGRHGTPLSSPIHTEHRGRAERRRVEG